MEGEGDSVDGLRPRERAQPLDVLWTQLIEREARHPRSGRTVGRLDEAAVLVAGDAQPTGGEQTIGDGSWIERSVEAVPEVDDAIDVAAGDVGEHGVECPPVPVNVGNDGEAHAATRIPRCRGDPRALQSAARSAPAFRSRSAGIREGCRRHTGAR